jgi:hypothetical protein
MKFGNPFKTWGSYVGLVGGVLFSYISLKFFLPDYVDLKIAIESNLCAGMPECISHMVNIPTIIGMQYILYGILGFILGYTIHSLFRRKK